MACKYGRLPGGKCKKLYDLGLNGLLTSDGVKLSSGFLVGASTAASAYHGLKRNAGSVPWAVWWGLMGAIFPIITPVIAIGQGFAEPVPTTSGTHGDLGMYWIENRPDPTTVFPPSDLMFRYFDR